jgi:hypothetical protein
VIGATPTCLAASASEKCTARVISYRYVSNHICWTKSMKFHGRPGEGVSLKCAIFAWRSQTRVPRRSELGPNPPGADAATIPYPVFRSHPHPPGATRRWPDALRPPLWRVDCRKAHDLASESARAICPD